MGTTGVSSVSAGENGRDPNGAELANRPSRRPVLFSLRETGAVVGTTLLLVEEERSREPESWILL